MIIKKVETETHPVMEMIVDSMLILWALYFCLPAEVFEFISSIMLKAIGVILLVLVIILTIKWVFYLMWLKIGDD